MGISLYPPFVTFALFLIQIDIFKSSVLIKSRSAFEFLLMILFLCFSVLLKILSIALLLAVGVVLILGIGTLFKGGETSKKYSNKLMQLRVLLQFIAIIALVGFAYFFKN